MRNARPDERKRIVLILPTETYRADAFMAAAAALDAEVVVATEMAPPLAGSMEDRLVTVDLETPEASAHRIIAAAERERIDAVVGVDDRGVLIAAHAAELLDLVGNPPDAVAATRDKVDMRRILRTWGVPQPEFRAVRSEEELVEALAEIGAPAVLKPLSLSASTGVIRVDTPSRAVDTYERIRAILRSHDRPADEPLLLERFVPGAEVSLEGLLRDGDLEVLALFDKPDAHDGPFFEETIYTTPSRLPTVAQEAVREVIASGCRALGLRNGPIHGEVRLRTDTAAPEPVVLEIAARSIGGLCSRALTFGTGTTLEEVILRRFLGLDPVDGATGASGVMMLPIPRSGILRAVEGAEAAAAVPGIVDLEISAAIGREILALPEGGRYLGFLFARADTPAEVERALRDAHARLRFRIEEPPPAPPPIASTS